MARRYGTQVEVDRRAEAPVGFVWRGRRYAVRAVLDHWMRAGRWWGGPAALALLGGTPDTGDAAVGPGGALDDGEREFWRVEAGRDRTGAWGVYDLCRDAGGDWTVARVWD